MCLLNRHCLGDAYNYDNDEDGQVKGDDENLIFVFFSVHWSSVEITKAICLQLLHLAALSHTAFDTC